MIGKQSSSTKWQLTVFYVSQIKVIGSTLITLFSEVPHLQWWTAQCFTHTRTHTHMHSHLPTDQTPHISSHELWVCNKYDNNLFATKTQVTSKTHTWKSAITVFLWYIQLFHSHEMKSPIE